MYVNHERRRAKMNEKKHRINNFLRNLSFRIHRPKIGSLHESGKLSPTEFVKAGDRLISVCPTWKWMSCDPDDEKSYLPPNKQFLVTKGVLCSHRNVHRQTIEHNESLETYEQQDWVITEDKYWEKQMKSSIARESVEEIIIPPSSFSSEVLIDQMHYSCNVPTKAEKRTYDISITYDELYQTPHVYLRGYKSNGLYLSTDKMMQDVDMDYILNTVSSDPHPFHLYECNCLSIHPCMHASTMAHMLFTAKENGRLITKESYLLVFLTFIMSVIPSIECDKSSKIHSFISLFVCSIMEGKTNRLSHFITLYLEKSNVIIVELGTFESRIGFAGDEATQVDLPSNIVYYKKQTKKGGDSQNASFQVVSVVGESKPWKYKDAEVTPLIKDLNVRSWEGVEGLITHAVQDWLCINVSDCPILLVEPPIVTNGRRQKFSELLFEKLQAPSLLMYKDAALTCFARGRTKGVVVDLGEEYTKCSAVIDGFVPEEHVVYQQLGGKRLCDLYIQKCLPKSLSPPGGTAFISCSSSSKTAFYRSLGRDLNHRFSFVVENPYEEKTPSVPTQSYSLPDGKSIVITDAANTIPELLFHPTALDDPGLKPLPLLIADQLTQCAGETTFDLASNVMLTGGLSRIKGLSNRLGRELSVMSNGAARLAPLPENEYQKGSFLGASILGSLSSFSEMVVTKKEYEESGVQAIQRKCP